jgi:hypothetical protein
MDAERPIAKLIDGAVVYPAYTWRVLFDSGQVIDVVAAAKPDSDVTALILEHHPGAGGIAAMVNTGPAGWYTT